MPDSLRRFIGRHRYHLVFAARGTAAALAALGAAIVLKLENPYRGA